MLSHTYIDSWEGFTGVEQLFWVIAIVSSILFIMQFVLSLIGLDFNGDLDIDTDSNADLDVDSDFTIFSVRSIISFFTFFGWIGLIALKNGAPTWVAVGSGGFAGLLAMFLVGYMMYKFSKFDESGTFSTKETLNRVGEVYLVIPANKIGYGKIHLEVKGALKEMDAVTDETLDLKNGEKVKVVEILRNNLLLVRRWN